jgi:hypothetical protein
LPGVSTGAPGAAIMVSSTLPAADRFNSRNVSPSLMLTTTSTR